MVTVEGGIVGFSRRKRALALVAVVLMMAVGTSVPLVDRTETAQAHTASETVSYARTFLGTPYVWGGFSRAGLDCSAFTSLVFQVKGETGYDLPDWPGVQMGYGQPVYGELQPGDLVFFSEYGGEITHVGIYSGNGMLIHASSYYGAVVETEMKWMPGYVGARRL